MAGNSKNRGGWRGGFGAGGLIGLLVVMLIILALYFGNFGGGSYSQQLGQARKQGVELGMQINTQQLVTLIVQHKLQHDRLPRTVEELDPPPGSFVDRWGGPITFTYEEAGMRTVVVFRSAGPDGEEGTEDDVEVRADVPV